MRLLRAAAAAVALCGLWLLAGAGPALAHAELRGSSPAAGDRLGQAPGQFRLDFTEGVTLTRDGIRLLAADGESLPIGDPSVSGATVRVPVSGLGEGAYVLVWRVVSADSHPVHGAVPFAVGDAEPPTVEGLTGGTDRTVAAVLALARWFGYAGTALLIGPVALVAWCWPAGGRRVALRRLVVGGASVTVGTALVGLLAQGPYAAGGTLSDLADVALAQATASTAYGWAALARLVLVVAFAAWAFASLSGHTMTPGRRLTGAGLGLGLAATFSIQGHAWAAGQQALAVTVDALHVLAMSVWLGGLAALAAVALRPSAPVPHAAAGPAVVLTAAATGVAGGQPVTPPAEAGSAVGDPDPDVDRTAAPDLRRWSQQAMAAVTVLVVTGTLAGLREVGGWPALPGTGYGRLLLVKLALVAAMLGLAVRARAWVQRCAGPRVDVAPDPPPRALRASVLGESVLGAVVLAVTAVLVATTPATSSRSVEATGNLPDGSVAIVTADGDRLLAVRVEAANGDPALPIEVSSVASLPGRDVEDLPIELHATGDTWAAHGDPLPFPGTWRVTVTVRMSELDAGVTTVFLAVP